jgi:hypothetical protein
MTSEKTPESWVAALDEPLRQIGEALRRLILAADPELKESIKWGNPVYEKQGFVCYLAATKAYVSLGFFNGAGLSDPNQVIEGTGEKMRHVKVRHVGEVPSHQLTAWVQEAVALNLGRSR